MVFAGPEWDEAKYGDQDGGPGGNGLVEAIDAGTERSPSFAWVAWDSGSRFKYPILVLDQLALAPLEQQLNRIESSSIKQLKASLQHVGVNPNEFLEKSDMKSKLASLIRERFEREAAAVAACSVRFPDRDPTSALAQVTAALATTQENAHTCCELKIVGRAVEIFVGDVVVRGRQNLTKQDSTNSCLLFCS